MTNEYEEQMDLSDAAIQRNITSNKEKWIHCQVAPVRYATLVLRSILFSSILKL
jgi:hypothetical protein